jgi:hypothetical protein
MKFQPAIPTRGTEVPAGPDWLHEIKHDGYRLIVQRQGDRVRLFTRRGFDCSDRYPLIVEAALKLRTSYFVIDGEAVWLGEDGVSNFERLHYRKHNAEVRLVAFDLLAVGGDDLRSDPLQDRKSLPVCPSKPTLKRAHYLVDTGPIGDIASSPFQHCTRTSDRWMTLADHPCRCRREELRKS